MPPHAIQSPVNLTKNNGYASNFDDRSRKVDDFPNAPLNGNAKNQIERRAILHGNPNLNNSIISSINPYIPPDCLLPETSCSTNPNEAPTLNGSILTIPSPFGCTPDSETTECEQGIAKDGGLLTLGIFELECQSPPSLENQQKIFDQIFKAIEEDYNANNIEKNGTCATTTLVTPAINTTPPGYGKLYQYQYEASCNSILPATTVPVTLVGQQTSLSPPSVSPTSASSSQQRLDPNLGNVALFGSIATFLLSYIGRKIR